jgi:small conductance mechanosensitive channel
VLAQTALPPFIPETGKLIEIGLRLAATIVVAFLLLRVVGLLANRGERWLARVSPEDGIHGEQRARTLGQIVRSLGIVLVVGGAIIHALDVLGWDVKPLLAGAGILGVALGFGAQTLVRDVIAGFFILIEDQFAVGDLIEVAGKPATVEAVTLRVTTLRDFNGFVHFVPNGEMKVVTNRSRGWNRLAVDVPIASGEDLDRAFEVCREVASGINQDALWRERLLDPVDLWGVESLNSQEILLRMVLRARPGPDAPEVARELRRRLLSGFARAGIRMAPTREIAITPLQAGDGLLAAPRAAARPPAPVG